MADPVEILDEATCWELLRQEVVGRLAVFAAGETEIFPVNFAVDGTAVVFRTAAGTKLVEVVIAGRVAFEADHHDPVAGIAWSVVVKGRAEVLDRFDDIYAAAELPVFPWHASPKERFVRIHGEAVSGRRFAVAQRRPDTTV